MSGLLPRILICATASCCVTVCAWAQTSLAQYGSEINVEPGTLLVANEKLGDPNFAESVVLILDKDEDGTLGVIINRPSRISLSQLFPEIKDATKDPVYAGGPVGLTFGQALVRSDEKLNNAKQVEGDVFATGEKKAIEKLVSSHTAPSKFRLYLGYAGWAPDQLEGEIRIGAWTVLRRGPGVLFDGDPETLWDRLKRESEMRVVQFRSLIGRNRPVS